MKKNLFSIILSIVLLTKVHAQYAVTSIPYNPYSFSTGTPVLVGTDDIWSGVINLSFNFYFFGTNYNQLIIGANGCISFSTVNAGAYCSWSYTVSCPDPNIISGSTGPFILGPYHDIDPGVGGSIYYATYDSVPYRKFVISWYNIPMFSCNSLLATHQIVLYESSNYIDIYIQDKPVCSTWNGGVATIGIQNAAGTFGFSPPGRNTSVWTATNEAWRFSTSGPFVNIANIVDADCGSSNGSISTIVSLGVPPYTFLWNTTPPQTGQNLTNVPPGYYCVSITDFTGDTASACGTVDTTAYATPDICMVNVDTASNHNLVIWEKPVTTGIDKYYIFRETSISGVYNLIGTQNYSDFSTFIDTSSNSLQQPYRYELAIHDNCGFTSLQSSYHQTIHLTISSGMLGAWNLVWNNYEGFSFSTYNIYRGTNPGNLTLLNSVANSVNSYTDLTPPPGIVYYMIEAVRPTPCNPSLKSGNNYYSSISNIAYDGIVSVSGNSPDELIQLYPKPAIGEITVSGAFIMNSKLEILNSLGQMIYQENLSATAKTIDISGFSKGMYFFVLKGNEFTFYKKIVLQ